MSGIKRRCVALNCEGTSTLTHRFPRDYERCRIWAERAGCPQLMEKGVDVLNTSYRLCSDHFRDKSYTSTERKRLSNYALPEIFAHNSGNFGTENEVGPGCDDVSEEPREISADHLCRVCARKSDDLVPVFGEKGVGMQLLDKIHTHLPIMVTSDDLLPITVCMDCIYKLEICHEFVHCCLEADAKLREILGLDTDNEAYIDESIEAECSTGHSPLETKEELDSEQDTNMYEDSGDSQDKGNHVEPTDMLKESQEEYHDVDSYAHEEYVIEESSDGHAEDDDDDDDDEDDDDETALVKSELSENVSQSEETEKPKFKVIVVKMKNADNMTEDARIEKALDVLKNVQTASHSESGKQHFVEQEKLEQPQDKELSCLQSDEVPHDLTTCLFDDSSTINHRILSDGSTAVSDTKVEQQISSDIYEDTFSTEATESNSCSAVMTQVIKKETPVDHSYTRWDQAGYKCVYCKKTFVGKVNLVSHQTSCHPEKMFHCPEGDVIVHECEQRFKDRKRPHMQKKEFGEDIIKINWHATDSSCLEEGKNLVSDNGSINEMFKYRQSEKDVETHKANSLETDVESRLVLPALKISAQNMAALRTKAYKQTGHNVVEIVRMADILVEPEGCILKERKSKFRVKISKNFENIDNNVKSKIIGAIRGIIKESENKRSKVKETGWSHQDGEEMHNPTASEETAPEKKPKGGGIQPRRLRCKHCDHMSVSLEEHLRHVHERCPVSFTCTHCDKQFSSKTGLQLHTSIHTQEKPFICEYCGKCFRNRQSLKNHLYTHDQGEKLFECQDCGKKFGTRGGYESHCASHSEASCLCDLCGKRMKHTRSLRVHRLTHVDPSFFRRYCCTVCGKACRNRYLLTEHMRVHNNERPFRCSHCEKCFHKRSQLSQHIQVHADERQHICTTCGKGFNRLGNLKMHIKTHEDVNKYTCKVCKETFNSLGELISHRRMHSREEVEEAMKQPQSQGSDPLVYVCDVCGKQLASKLTLKYHMMMHSEDKPFTCGTCGKSFAVRTKLQLHERIHNSKKPYQCSFCDEGFQTKQYRLIHERIHTGERPYKCTLCSKAFRSRMLVNQHMLVHSDVRPFKCTLCDKSFRRRDTLDTHMRIHTGERPYNCYICGRGFKQKGDCNKHQRTHFKGRKGEVLMQESSDPVTFTCILCGLNFDQKEELDSHFEALHAADVIVSSNTMIINTENIVTLPEISQDEKAIIVPHYGAECDAS